MKYYRNMIVGLAIAACLPIFGHYIRQYQAERCGFDGMPIQPIYRTLISLKHGKALSFCCLLCAENWLKKNSSQQTALFVTDEVTGCEFDASLAHFVYSSIITVRHTQCRVHVFRSRSDAEKHASIFQGEILTPDESLLKFLNAPDKRLSKVVGGVD